MFNEIIENILNQPLLRNDNKKKNLLNLNNFKGTSFKWFANKMSDLNVNNLTSIKDLIIGKEINLNVNNSTFVQWPDWKMIL